jgi:PAS domain S-box-containing protein
MNKQLLQGLLMYKHLLFLLLLLPVLLFSRTDSTLIITADKQQLPLNNKTELTALIDLVSLMSNTIHSIQQERGVSTGFVSSNGAKFKSKLDKIKIKSDVVKQKLLLSLNLNYGQLKKYFTSSDRDNLNLLFDEVFVLREDVRNLNIDFAKTYSKYTQIIAYLLLDISNISDIVENKELKDVLYSYSTLLLHKESIGQKRASLSGLFSQEVFSKEIYEYFLTSDTQEKIYLKSFLHSVDEKTKKLYLNTLDTIVTKKVKEYEKLALKKLKGESVNADPEAWFENITKKINLVQDIEYKVFNNILILVDKLNNDFYFSLTESEKEWLKKKEIIKYVYDPDWAPFEWKNGINQHVGILSDILKLIEQKSELKFKAVHSNSWIDALLNIKNTHADMVDGISENTERKEYLSFSNNSLFTVPYVFVSNNKSDFSKGFESITNEKISFIDGYAIEALLKKYKANLKYDVVKNVTDGFKKLSNGDIDIFLVNQATAKYILKQKKYKNLKISYSTEYKLELKVAMRKDYPKEALSIIDKALNLITTDDINDIYQKWFSKSYTVKDSNELNIAFHFDRPPYMFNESSSKGIEADLVKEAFSTQGYKVNVYQMGKSTMESLLENNEKFDGVASVSDSGDKMYYSDKYSLYKDYAITRKKDNIKIDSIDDLSRHNFVAWKNAYNDLGKEFHRYFNPKDGLFKSFYHHKTSQKDQHKLFFNKKINVIIVDKMIFEWYKMDFNNQDEYTFHDVLPLATNSVVKFKNKNIRDIFNKGLTEIRKSKRYDEVVDFYLTQDIRPLLQYSNLISAISGYFVFSEKQKILKKVLNEFFQHPDIIHIEVFDNKLNRNLVSLYKEDGKVIEAEDNDKYHNSLSIEKKLFYTNNGRPTNVGKITIFYKNSFNNDNGVLIPKLNFLTELNEEDEKSVENAYNKFGLNVKTIKLSQEEKEWIKIHPTVKFTGDPNWLPFEAFNKDGNYIGIIAEYLDTLERLTGIKFERISTETWSESVKLSEEKDVDVLSETIEANRKHLIFTKPYITNDIVIVMDKEHKYVEGLEAIRDDKIALIKDYGYTKQIEEKYPYINFITVDTVGDGLTAVSTGKVDAMVCTFAHGSYTTTKMGVSNIKIVGKTQFTTSLGLGVRDDYAPLVNILNKAIDSITQEQHNEIFNHWIKQDYVEKVDYSLLYKVSGGAFVLILMFIFWNRKMAKEIDKRKLAEAEVKESQVRFSTLFDASPDSISIINEDGAYTDCNKATINVFGLLSKEEFLKLRPADLSPEFQYENKLSSELTPEVIKIALEKGSNRFEWLHKRIDTNEVFDAEVILTSVLLNDKPHIYAVVRDITDRKLLENTIKQNNHHMTFVSENANLGFWNFNPQIGDLFVNDIFVTMLGYNPKEVLKDGYSADMFKPFKDGLAFWEQLLHPDDVDRTTKILMAHINGETDLYKVDYRMRKSDGSWMWSTAIGKIAEYDEDGKPIRFNGVNLDITDQKKAQEEIEKNKLFLDAVLDSQEQIVITTDGEKLVTGNKKFYDFYDLKSVGDFISKYGNCICETFDENAKEGFLQTIMDNGEQWIDYIINNPYKIHKVIIIQNDNRNVFTVTAAEIPGDEGLKSAVFTNITALEQIREEIESINKHTQDSIEYASLIQHALLPEQSLLNEYFDDYLTIWQPKDTVGGDIYLFEELRDKDECLLMVIDCTGHGVAGAFVTMLVKALERQIVAKINNDKDIEVSTAWILSYFNRTMKKLLQQENSDSISNAGFDGGIIYYNKKEKIIKFSGAEIALYYVEEDELKIIKGNRYSVGYKKCDMDYEYKEHIIEVKDGMKFYIPTDGYLDQNGGDKSFPFGKKKYTSLILENHHKTFANQKEILLDALSVYQRDEERNDDITMVSFKI